MGKTTKQSATLDSRRSFLGKGLALGAGTIGAAILSNTLTFDSISAAGEITDGDVAILRWLAAAELIEADLWDQYATMAEGNQGYHDALTNVDDSSPRYARDTTDDEVSHHMLINAFLKANGKPPVDFDDFRTIPSPKVSKGGTGKGNLTNLTNLTASPTRCSAWRMRRTGRSETATRRIASRRPDHRRPIIVGRRGMRVPTPRCLWPLRASRGAYRPSTPDTRRRI